MKNKILLFGYSIVLIPIWGLTLLDKETSTTFSVFICFVFTLASYYTIQRAHRLDVRSHLLILAGPTFYILSYLVLRPYQYLEIAFSPILWLYIIFMIFILVRKRDIKLTWIFFLFGAYFYGFHIYPMYKRLIGDDYAYAIGPPVLPQDEKLKNRMVDLNSYVFINAEGVLTNIELDGRPVLIETWNEKCAPCLSSIKRLESFIETGLQFKHIYLYENMGSKNLSLDQIYSFDEIKDPTKIWVDKDNFFFNSIGMGSYPYFLFFDKNGRLVDHFIGYSDKIVVEVQDRLEEMSNALNTANR